MKAALIILLVLLVAGILAKPRTLAHTFAVAVDILAQGVFYDAPIGVTISSRAALAARAGKPWLANIICWVFRDPAHCEDAIKADIERAQQALSLLSP